MIDLFKTLMERSVHDELEHLGNSHESTFTNIKTSYIPERVIMRIKSHHYNGRLFTVIIND